MPPRVVNASEAGTGFKAWYESVPPITRTLATAMLAVTLAANFSVIPPVWIALLWKPILTKFEIWRLVTNFFMLGGLGFPLVMRMLWVLQYGAPLERSTYQFEPADFLYMLLFNGLLLLLASSVLNLYFLGAPLIMSLIYVWSRNFPDGEVSLYGLIKIRSFYLPFAFAAITVILGGSVVSDAAGIAAGHVYYFLKEVYPLQSGNQLIVTPGFLKNWLADAGVRGAAPPPAQAQGAPAGFHAFRGQGRRLGGS